MRESPRLTLGEKGESPYRYFLFFIYLLYPCPNSPGKLNKNDDSFLKEKEIKIWDKI
jgi:hypothetical protein